MPIWTPWSPTWMTKHLDFSANKVGRWSIRCHQKFFNFCDERRDQNKRRCYPSIAKDYSEIKGKSSIENKFEPPHDKPTKWPVRPAKTQLSLDIRPVWSESSLCAQCVAKDPRFLHADSEDSDQSGLMARMIWVFAGHTCHFVGFVMRQLRWKWQAKSRRSNPGSTNAP